QRRSQEAGAAPAAVEQGVADLGERRRVQQIAAVRVRVGGQVGHRPAVTRALGHGRGRVEGPLFRLGEPRRDRPVARRGQVRHGAEGVRVRQEQLVRRGALDRAEAAAGAPDVRLLGLLEREPSHGYDLKRDYDTYFGRGKPLPYGQVYATLARLARDGKAVAGEAEPGGGPDRKRYAITTAGAAEVGAWLAEPSEPEPHLQTGLFAKVVLALILGRPAEA